MKEKLARTTWIYTGVLILLGVIGYFATGAQSVTALIPAFFGVLVFMVLLATRRLRAAASLWTLLVVGVVGFLATVSGIPKLVGLIGGEELERPAAAVSQTIMALASVIYSVALLLSAKLRRGVQPQA